jgi:hypothetical protein
MLPKPPKPSETMTLWFRGFGLYVNGLRANRERTETMRPNTPKP